MIFGQQTTRRLDAEVVLRIMHPDDIKTHYPFFEANRQQIAHHEGWVQEVDEAAYYDFLQTYWRLFSINEGFFASIISSPLHSSSPETYMGNIGMKRLSQHKVEIFFWLAQPYHGQGVMTRVLKSVSKRLVLKRIHQVRLVIAADNLGAQHVAKRALYRPVQVRNVKSDLREMTAADVKLYVFP